MRGPLLLLLLAAACSLTPIPDVSSEWVEPCETTRRLCVVPFVLKVTAEQSVELRGDFRDGGWVQGEPMVKDGGTWEASITAGWGNPVQYKFFVDNTRWLLDPTNTHSVPDGKGNTNSLLESVSCAKWTCVPAQ
jgi:hypothetical protein